MVARIAARTSVMLAATSLSLPSPALAAKEPLALAPSSAWVMSYDAESCRLARSFGTGDQQVVAHFTKFRPGTAMSVIITGKSLSAIANQTPFRVHFEPGAVAETLHLVLFGDTPEGTRWQLTTALIAESELDEKKHGNERTPWHAAREAERAAEVRRFVVSAGRAPPLVLETGRLAEPMAAMDKCLDDLVTRWGFDPQVQRTLQRAPTPRGNPARWLGPDDYPRAALRNSQMASVTFRLGISAEGTVTSCAIESANSDPAFKEAVCKAMSRRARFDPAIDAAGLPVASYWGSSVAFTTL